MIQEGPELDRLKAEMNKTSVAFQGSAIESLKQFDEVDANDFEWESNKDDENLRHLPWPDENESKE